MTDIDVRDIGTDRPMLASGCDCRDCRRDGSQDVVETREALAALAARSSVVDITPTAVTLPLVQLRRNVWGIGPVVEWHAQYLTTLDAMRQYVMDGPGTSGYYEREYLALCERWQTRPVWTAEGYDRRMARVEDLVTQHYEGNGGTNCLDGTNSFLVHFGFLPIDPCASGTCEDSDCDTCNPEVRRTFTLTIEVTVDGRQNDDEDELVSDLERRTSVSNSWRNIDVTSTSAELDDTETIDY